MSNTRLIPRLGLATAIWTWSIVQGAAGQIADRVTSVRDGIVRMSFAAREGVCWYRNGESFTTRHRTDQWEADCQEGPVRVAIEREGGEYVDLHTYVGGRWRGQAALDLGEVGAVAATAFLLDIARTYTAPVAEKAILPATLADSVTIWPDLARIARDRTRPRSVREAAVFWMGQTEDVATVGVLLDIMNSETDMPIREKAIFGLSQHESDSAGRALYRIADSPTYDTQIRDRAIFWLGQRRRDDAVNSDLRSLFDRLEDPELRERVIFAVSQRHNEDAQRWVLQVALDRAQPLSLRKQAIFWAGQSGNDVNALIDAYDRIDELPLREHLIFTLSQRHRDPAALNKLIEIASGTSDPELRRKAIFWLGQSRDPKAIGFLEELIKR
jgi:HEAT repeats